MGSNEPLSINAQDKYLVLVLAGMEHFIAAEYEKQLRAVCDFVRVSVCSPRYLIDTNAKEIEGDCSESAFGMPCGYGHAAVGKLIIETSATPQDIRAIPYAQALFAFLYAPLDDTYKGGIDIPLGPFGTQRFYLGDDKETQLLGLKALLREPNISEHTWTRAVQLWKRCMLLWGDPDTKQLVQKTVGGIKNTMQSNSAGAVPSTCSDLMVSYRASCVRDGPHAFKSIDALGLLGGVVKAFNPDWKVNLNEPNAEVVTIVNREHVVFGLSLMDRSQSFSHHKICPEHCIAQTNFGVALRPSTAAVMVRLAQCASGVAAAADKHRSPDPTTGTPTDHGHPEVHPSPPTHGACAEKMQNADDAVLHTEESKDISELTRMQAPPSLLTLLDPCGGTGTIPTVAAAMMAPSLLGGATAAPPFEWLPAESSSNCSGAAPNVFAVTSEIENVAVAKDAVVRFPTDALRANAVTLPFRTGCMDVVASDLPFGLKCLKRKALDKLYPRLLKEIARVLHPTHGVLVALTAQHGSKLMTHALHYGAWDLVPGFPSCLPVSIGGCRSDIFIARPHPDGASGMHPPPPMSKKERRKAQLAKRATDSDSLAP
eukprot:m.1236376 g.1236376  ORF g.1236376 m.1236376 type:complete len:598 (+) comp24666_c0_seq8:232-2025(+)